MKTQTPPAQSKPEMLALENILVPLNFSPASNNAAKKERVMETTVESLATRVALHPFLVGMNRQQLALLTSCAVAIQFEKGQVLCREGELADRFYLIEAGRVVLESNGVLDDPLLGCSWIFPSHAWTFTARAVEPTTVIFFSAPILREHCERDHSLGYELLKRMSLLMHGRMQAARNKMQAIHHRSDTLQPGGDGAVGGADTSDPEVKIVKMYPVENADRECGRQLANSAVGVGLKSKGPTCPIARSRRERSWVYADHDRLCGPGPPGRRQTQLLNPSRRSVRSPMTSASNR